MDRYKLRKEPDQPFHNFRALISGDWRILFCSGTSYDGFGSFKFVKGLVGKADPPLKKNVRERRTMDFEAPKLRKGLSGKCRRSTTDTFSNYEPQNPRIDEPCVVRERRSRDFEALNL